MNLGVYMLKSIIDGKIEINENSIERFIHFIRNSSKSSNKLSNEIIKKYNLEKKKVKTYLK